MKDAKQIQSIDTIRDRCLIDEETDCWHWLGAKTRTKSGMECRVHIRALGGVLPTARAAWLLSGKTIPERHTVWRTCRVKDCCNPAHLMCGTKRMWGKWQERSGHLRGDLKRSASSKRFARQRKTVVLTEEFAQWIRESRQTGRDAAHGIGISPQLVSKVRCGTNWAPIAASSVFSFSGLLGKPATRPAEKRRISAPLELEAA